MEEGQPICAHWEQFWKPAPLEDGLSLSLSQQGMNALGILVPGPIIRGSNPSNTDRILPRNLDFTAGGKLVDVGLDLVESEALS